MNFKIKICGITSVGDALAAVDAGADALGLNFYPRSKRFIDPALARKIVDAVAGRAEIIGLFVNEQAATIATTCRAAAVQIVQLHGDDSPGIGELRIEFDQAQIEIIRAHNFGPRGLMGVHASLHDARGEAFDAVLIDAAVSGQFGGTGHTFDWSQLIDYEASLGAIPLILAGGLTPENVAEAIRVVRPWAVDVASGVESAPGKKDVGKMQAFVAAAQQGFAGR